jgi:hypothetical protein
LSQSLRQFIEVVVHNFPLVIMVFVREPLYAATALQLAYIDAGKKTILRGAAEAGLIAFAVECLGFSAVRQSKPGQCDASEPNAEFPQRSAARDGLSQTFGQFIEFFVHNFPFVC